MRTAAHLDQLGDRDVSGIIETGGAGGEEYSRDGVAVQRTLLEAKLEARQRELHLLVLRIRDELAVWFAAWRRAGTVGAARRWSAAGRA